MHIYIIAIGRYLLGTCTVWCSLQSCHDTRYSPAFQIYSFRCVFFFSGTGYYIPMYKRGNKIKNKKLLLC